MMADRRLETFGRLVYGSRWQVELAAALGTTTRTIRRWHAGHTAMPDDAWAELKKLAVKRRGECHQAVQMARALEGGPVAAPQPSANEDTEPAVEPVPEPVQEAVPEPVVVAAPADGVRKKKPAVSSRRRKLLAALTAEDVRVNDTVRVRDRAGVRTAFVIGSDPEKRLHMTSVGSGRRLEDPVYDEGRFVAVVDRPGIGKQGLLDVLATFRADNPQPARPAPVQPPEPEPEYRVKKPTPRQRERLLAALTAEDVGVHDEIVVSVDLGDGKGLRQLPARVTHSYADGQGLRMTVTPKRGRQRRDVVFDPAAFVTVTKRHGIGEVRVPVVPAPAPEPEPVVFQEPVAAPDSVPLPGPPSLREETPTEAIYFRTASEMDRYHRRETARAKSVGGLGYSDLTPGDLIEVTYMGGERDAEVTRFDRRGTPMYRSRQKGGGRPGEWDTEQPLDEGRFLRVTHREGY